MLINLITSEKKIMHFNPEKIILLCFNLMNIDEILIVFETGKSVYTKEDMVSLLHRIKTIRDLGGDEIEKLQLQM